MLIVGSMLPFDDIEPAAVDRLTNLADTQVAIKERLKLSTDREAAWRTYLPLNLKIGHIISVYYERIDNCQKLKDRFIGPYKVLCVLLGRLPISCSYLWDSSDHTSGDSH